MFRFSSIAWISAILAGCMPMDGTTAQVASAWGLGWQARAPQNRIGPAIPPIVAFLRKWRPKLQPEEPQATLVRTYRNIVFELRGEDRKRLADRLIAIHGVKGLGCVMRGYPVRDQGAVVAAFLVLDVRMALREPPHWRLCNPGQVPEGYAAAVRALLLAEVNRALRAAAG